VAFAFEDAAYGDIIDDGRGTGHDAPAKSSRWRRSRNQEPALPVGVDAGTSTLTVDIAPNDPCIAYFAGAPAAVELDTVTLESPAITAMREAGVTLVVPLVTNGELVGLLQLGPRLSERGYSKDDRQLLESLARYAAPALRLGQLVRQQQVEARDRERLDQELKVAQLIQQQFLPEDLPDLPTWHVAAFYRPARTIGGDFYDFISMPDGRVMVVVGDVTDKGVPAALVMASTHALLRETGSRLSSPGEVLARVNDLLCDDIPAHMFVTCLVLVIDSETGRVDFANAGHNLPYVRATDGTVRELRATGMPLGLMPGLSYDESTAVIAPGEQVLLYSDGLTEQHDAAGEMFGFGRTAEVVAKATSADELADLCVSELARFTGPDVEQEDDITMVALERANGAGYAADTAERPDVVDVELARFSVASETGNERDALRLVEAATAHLDLSSDQRSRLGTAVAETTMNAIEHGNGLDADKPVEVVVNQRPTAVEVLITDQGGTRPDIDPVEPDLELKLAGLQTPRGWGLFLVENMVDSVTHEVDGSRHTVRLTLNLEERPT
jgi:serine phosphatase RsbU (regulator of sigma subunit)/anti-sigma regulatory factor (Ser/Thr protein kinase)